MVIVDTSVWIDYFAHTSNAETSWLERELTLQRIALTDLIICEVLQGIRQDAAFGKVRREFFRFGGHALLHRDRDLVHVNRHLGLQVIHPLFPY